MTRRSTSQQQIDDRAFPVRVRFRVPPGGLGQVIDRMGLWLREEMGADEAGAPRWAWHAGGHFAGRDATALHFRTIEDAARFRAAFPALELADGVGSGGYSRPGYSGARG